MEIKNFSATIKNNVRQLRDTPLILQNMLSFRRAFEDTLISKELPRCTGKAY